MLSLLSPNTNNVIDNTESITAPQLSQKTSILVQTFTVNGKVRGQRRPLVSLDVAIIREARGVFGWRSQGRTTNVTGGLYWRYIQ